MTGRALHPRIHVFAVLILGPATIAVTPDTAHADPPAHSDISNYEFDDEIVRGDTSAPTLEVLHVRTRKARASLVRIREHFLVELYKSVEKQ